MKNMTTPQDIEHFFEVAKALTLEAAKIIRSSINELKEIETKSFETDLVTKYDREVEKILFVNLSKEFPNHKFIGEETSSNEEKIPELTDSPTWIIDPIDGTTNFVHSFPQICISIGLAINKQIEIGIIYNPCYDEMYTAKRGQGTFLNGRPIQTSTVNELKKSLVDFETSVIPSHVPNRDIALGRLIAFVNVAHGVRTVGSAALVFAFIARGAIDIFQMDGLQPWDVAAGYLIVTEAGGTVIDTKGGPFDFMNPRVLATSTEALATEALQLIIETDLQTQRKRLKKVTCL